MKFMTETISITNPREEWATIVKTLNLKVEYAFHSKLMSTLDIFMLLNRGSS